MIRRRYKKIRFLIWPVFLKKLLKSSKSLIFKGFYRYPVSSKKYAMRILLAMGLLLLLLPSCRNSGKMETSGEFAGFTFEKIPGAPYQRAIKTESGRLIEEGMVRKGQKDGLWVVYHGDEKNFPKLIAHYVEGVLNGPYMEFNQFGQFLVVAQYRGNKLHGRVAKYNFTRLSEELHYVNGVLEGPYALYFPNSDVKQRTATFKNGVEDGLVRFFNEQGIMTMEYEYKDGKKISGGIVSPEKSEN